MARCPLVRPDTVRVSLSEGDWLEVKKELTSGEYRQVFVQQYKDTHAGERPVLNLDAVQVSRILGWVVDWSFVDFKGEKLPVSRDTIDKMHHDVFSEVDAAVDAHHSAWEKALEERKNAKSGEPTLSATSPSAA